MTRINTRPFRIWSQDEIDAWHLAQQRRDSIILRALLIIAVLSFIIGMTLELWLAPFGL